MRSETVLKTPMGLSWIVSCAPHEFAPLSLPVLLSLRCRVQDYNQDFNQGPAFEKLIETKGESS